MNQKILLALWGGMFALCAGLGFIPEPTGFLKFLMTALSLVFFIPPALLLHRAGKAGDRDTVCLVRNLAIAWVVLTAALLICNFLSVLGSAFLGNVLHGMLVIVTAPMVCGQHWVLTMFCWACLLFAGNHILKTMKTRT